LEDLANDQPADVIGERQRGEEDLMMKATGGLCLHSWAESGVIEGWNWVQLISSKQRLEKGKGEGEKE